jgi:hypothetical protein
LVKGVEGFRRRSLLGFQRAAFGSSPRLVMDIDVPDRERERIHLISRTAVDDIHETPSLPLLSTAWRYSTCSSRQHPIRRDGVWKQPPPKRRNLAKLVVLVGCPVLGAVWAKHPGPVLISLLFPVFLASRPLSAAFLSFIYTELPSVSPFGSSLS